MLTALPLQGTLARQPGGAAITLIELPLVLSGNQVFYTTTPNSADPQSFRFRVVDDGGTANGGQNTSADAEVSIVVTPVNSRPVAFPQNAIAIEDQQQLITLSGNVGDPEVEQELTYFISSLPTTGSLYRVDGTEILPGHLPLKLLVNQVLFLTAPNSTAAQSFRFFVRDDGGTANGGSNTSFTAAVNIQVAASNDPPVISAPNSLNIFPATTTPLSGLAVTLAGGGVSYRADNGFQGLDTLRISVFDGGATGTGPEGIAMRDVTLRVGQISSWQNSRDRLDVNDDGVVAPGDALSVTNYINANPNNSALPPSPQTPPPVLRRQWRFLNYRGRRPGRRQFPECHRAGGRRGRTTGRGSAGRHRTVPVDCQPLAASGRPRSIAGRGGRRSRSSH